MRQVVGLCMHSHKFSLCCWSSGHRNLSQVLSFTVFSFVNYIHIHMPLRMYWPRLFLWFSKKYSVYIILTVTMFVTSQSFISLPSFMFVSAAVSEIHNLNRTRRTRSLKTVIQFTTFPRNITDPFFNESYLLTTSTKLARSLVHHKLKVIIGISLSTCIMLANQGHPYIHSTTILCDKK